MEMKEVKLNLLFPENYRICIVGDSASGKSELSYKIASRMDELTPYHRILVVYQYFQPLYEKMKKHFGDKIIFTDDLTSIDFDDLHVQAEGKPNLLIFDDVINKLAANPECASLFLSILVGQSHHQK